MFSLRQLRFKSSTKKKGSPSDKRVEVLKKMMYGDENPRPIPTMTREQHEQHEIIERMWCLEKQREAVALKAQLERKYNAIKNAMDHLQKYDQRLFDEATKKDDKVRFPVKLRIPTETMPVKSWGDGAR